MDTVLTIVLTALASSGLFSFMTFLIQRKDNRKKEEYLKTLKRLEDKINEVEKGSIRTQMLILMNHYPNETSRIMMLAKKYFDDLKGDWYMTGLFNNWLTANNFGKPEWFDPKD